MTYALHTKVPVDRSKQELDKLLQKHGATMRALMSDDANGRACVAFCIRGLQYRLEVPLPPYKKNGDFERSIERHEQQRRVRWRAFVLLVKAKLESVELGLSTVEKEFLSDLVLPGGATVHVALSERIQVALAKGDMPSLLLPEKTQ